MRTMSFKISEGNGDDGVKLIVKVPELEELDEVAEQAVYDAFLSSSSPRVKIQNSLRDKYRDGWDQERLQDAAQKKMDAILRGEVYRLGGDSTPVVDQEEGEFTPEQIALLESKGVIVNK